ncbi:MAG TPA: AAA family ATPase [Terriglobia bacterium]|nr:AAA family ATPase [Terriglobia bacterium]
MAAPAEAIDPLSPLAILDTLNAKSAVFDHAAIEREIAKHTRDQEAAAQALAAVLQRPDLVQLTPTPESKEAPPAKYAMQATIELENRMLDTAERLHARASHDVESGAFKAAVAQYEAQAGHQLSDEQKEAAQHITEAGGLRAVVGLPGTGKTTMLTAARMAWEGAGYQVRGAALAGIAADNLAQSGIKSSTIAALLLRIDEQEDLHPLATTGEMTDAAVTRFARHLEREIERADNAESTAILQAWRDELMTGQLSQEAADYARAWATDTQRFAPLDTNTVLVIDEAGMIGSAQMARLLDAVEGTGAKIILVGDPEQIQPIEIGGAFRAIFQSTEGVTLEDVRRQRVEWMRAATKDISRGPADRAITAYDEAGAIHARINADRAETLGKLKTEHEITPEDERRINTIIDYVEARRAAGAAFRLIKEQSNDPLATLFYEFKEDRDSAAATIAADIEGYKPWLARFAINGEHLAADILVTENMSRRQAVEKAAGHAESIGILDIEKSLLPEDRYGLDLRSGAKRDLAAAWLADYQSAPDLSRIVLTHTNEDAADLNARIREGLKIIGVLQGEEIATVTEEGARTFMTGDRILFRRTHRFGASQDAVGVRNGTLGTISSTARASDGEIAFTVTLDGGQTFTFSPDEFDGYAPGYAVTTHKAQGVTVDRSFVLASLGMNKHLLGVAMSRHRDTTALFAATGDAASPSQVAKIAGKAERAETTIDYLREAAPAPAARFAEMHGIEASTTERTMDSRTWADRRRQWVAEQGTRLSKTWQAFRQQVQHRAQATLQPSQHAPNPIEMPALTARAQLALHKTFRAYADPTEARQRFLEMYAEKAGLAVWAVNNRPEVFGTGRAGERVSTFEPREAQISKAWRTEAARRLSVATPRAPLVAKAVAQAERSARRIAGDRQIARGREFSRNIARRAADRFGAMPGMTQTPQPRGPEPTPQAPAEAGTPRTSWWDRIRGRGRVPAETPNAPGTPAADKPAAATPAKAEPHWSERITAPRQKPGSQELRQLIARDLREIHAAKATDPMRAAAAREALAVHTQQLTERQIKAYPPKAQEEIRVVRRMNPQLNYGPARRRDRDKDIER